MKHNRNIILVCSVALVLFLALGILPRLWPFSGSRYNRQVDEDFFSLSIERLNCTIEEPFSLNKGDTIDVSLVRVSGELTISIGEKGQEPIYEGRNPELSDFRIFIPEDGDYYLSVSGKQVKGSISFQISRSAGNAVRNPGSAKKTQSGKSGCVFFGFQSNSECGT